MQSEFDMTIPELAKELTMEVGHCPAEPQYQTLPNHKIKQLAMDIVDGKVFGSWMMRDGDDRLMPTIFMPVMFMPEWWALECVRDKISQVYEYQSEAMPRGVNGYPCFGSMRLIDRNDVAKLDIAINKLVAMKQAFMNEDTTSNENGERNDHA